MVEARELPARALMLEVRERPALLAPLLGRVGREPTDELRRRRRLPPVLETALRPARLPTEELRRWRLSVAGLRAMPWAPGLWPSWLTSLAVEARRELAGEVLLLPMPESLWSAMVKLGCWWLY